jgi:hypothetical protein
MNLALAPEISVGKGESAEAYPRVSARLTHRLRVIEGACRLQWLLQVRKSLTRWETIAYCATKAGLLLRIKEHLQPRGTKEILPLQEIAKLCDPKAWAIVEALADDIRDHIAIEDTVIRNANPAVPKILNLPVL